MKKALILMNPIHPNTYFINGLLKVIDYLVKEEYEVETYATQTVGDGYKKISETKEVDLLVVAGGDGTIHSVVNGVCKNNLNPEILYFPSGTTNDFGSTLGLKKNVDYILNLHKENKIRTIDVGLANEEYFAYVIGTGLFSSVSYEASNTIKDRLGSVAYVMEGLKHISQFNDVENFKITIDDEEMIEKEVLIGIVSNSKSVAGIRKLFKNDEIDDGKMNLLLLDRAQVMNLMKMPKILTLGVSERDDGEGMLVKSFSKLKIETKDDVTWTMDGEKGPQGSIEIEVIEKRIKIYGM